MKSRYKAWKHVITFSYFLIHDLLSILVFQSFVCLFSIVPFYAMEYLQFKCVSYYTLGYGMFIFNPK